MVTYHGRDFQRQSLTREVYLVPVDDVSSTMIAVLETVLTKRAQEELERLEQQHRALTTQVLSDLPEPLFLAPVREPTRVLDCGHGSGAWVVEVAESYPGCEVTFLSSNAVPIVNLMQVIGVDFSPLMNPDDIPENLHLQVRLTKFLKCSSYARTTTLSITWSCMMRLGRFRSSDNLSLLQPVSSTFLVAPKIRNQGNN
jgi:hypothetical protein